MEEKNLTAIRRAQISEITEHVIYTKLAKKTKNQHNREILEKIALDEKRHAEAWQKITGETLSPRYGQARWYIFLSKIFGLSFGLKLMERGEGMAVRAYRELAKSEAQAQSLCQEEKKHEEDLLNMLSEERLEYAGSVVLGLNDALVELTGALAGLTFALNNGKIVAVSGLITGIAASLSMAASGYLQSREEADQNEEKNPIKSALYTGIAYIATVLVLVTPYLVFSNIHLALGVMLGCAIMIVAAYTFYITTAKSLKFWKRFLEMAFISLAVAAISFGVGTVLRITFGIEV